MTRILKLATLALLVAIGGASLTSASSLAATQDYRFELVDQTIHTGQDVPISVRLIQASTGKAVTGATIEPKLHMLMGSMAPMPSRSKALEPDSKGNYQFACDVMESGDWMLDLSAQVPGEKEPVTGMLKFQVVK
jgi:hypothetical protein